MSTHVLAAGITHGAHSIRVAPRPQVAKEPHVAKEHVEPSDVDLEGAFDLKPNPSTQVSPHEKWGERFQTVFGPGHVAEKYTEHFVNHLICHEKPNTLSDHNFAEIGIPIGHRCKINDMIANVKSGHYADKPSEMETFLSRPISDCPSSQSQGYEHTVTLTSKILQNNGIKKTVLGFPGLAWTDYEGEAKKDGKLDLDAFLHWVDVIVLQKGTPRELPATFKRAFLDNKPMSFVMEGSTLNGHKAHLVVLRLPTIELSDNPIDSKESTVANLTNRLVAIYIQSNYNDRLITYHRDPTDKVHWIKSLKESFDDANYKKGSVFFSQMVANAIEPAREILLMWRKQLEMLNEVDIGVAPTQIVEMQSLMNRQAQVLKRCSRSNMVALEDIQEAFAPYFSSLIHNVRDQVEMAEEIETNALDAMNLRMGLCGFRAQENMKFFTFISAIASPLAVMTGWYGMNFETMGELKMENSYWVFIAVAGFITVSMVVFLIVRSTATARQFTQDQLEEITKYKVRDEVFGRAHNHTTHDLTTCVLPTGPSEPIVTNPIPPQKPHSEPVRFT